MDASKSVILWHQDYTENEAGVFFAIAQHILEIIH